MYKKVFAVKQMRIKTFPLSYDNDNTNNNKKVHQYHITNSKIEER